MKRLLMMSKKQILSVIVLGMISVLLSGCGNGSRGSYCAIYEPVYTSPQDTEETKKQTDRNNAVWLENCD